MLNVKTKNYNENVKTNVRYRAYHFSIQIIRFISTFPEKKVFWVIGDQLLRSATSIGANLIEAKSASSKKDFIHYYHTALKSNNETKYWLCMLRDSNLIIKKEDLKMLISENEEIGNMIASSLITLKKKRQI